MKKYSVIYLINICLFLISDEAISQELSYWKDVQVTSVGREKPRTEFMSYDDAESANSQKFEESKNYKLLNGVWKFFYVDAYKDLPENVTSADVNTSSWNDIKVPANWEIQGYGVPIYVNHGYEFKARHPQPPLLPETNPAGVYWREFEIPADWEGRDIYLKIDGAKSGVYVYVNGREVGYNEDSKNPAEFLINKYLREGKNILTLKIFRWSTGTYLECQDFWRISGIERDVYLWSQPKIAVNDFNIVSTLDDTYKDGIFRMAVEVKNNSIKDKNVNVHFELMDGKGNVAAASEEKLWITSETVQTFSFDKTMKNVLKWSVEQPDLYKLLITVTVDGKIMEVVPYKVGFRRVEFVDSSQKDKNGKSYKVFLFNGQPIKFKGVNIHETSEKTGHYIPDSLMMQDFKLMKENNVNAIRLSHYPRTRRFYDACDEIGFYVYDEANVESHGMYYELRKGGTLGNDPEWLRPHLYRMENMYERNKNHASVTIWSMGNEAGNGYNFYESYLYLKSKDGKGMNRPVNYERALWEWNTDMYVPQYPSAAWLERTGQEGSDRPVVPSEYSHAMGNSNGNLYDQWKAIYKYPNLQGGFIWEWVDHGFLEQDEKGRSYWTYGGDYGVDMPSDGNFVNTGIVNPNRTPHPAVAEMKYVYQNVGFEQVDSINAKVRITNRFYFTNLDDKYEITCKLLKDGKLESEKILSVNLKPQESVELNTFDIKPVKSGGYMPEYFVNFSVRTNFKTTLIPSGFEIAKDQFQLCTPQEKLDYKARGGKLRIKEEGDDLIVVSPKVQFIFNRKSGCVTSYKVDNREYFAEGFGVQPNFWRGPTDNDYGSGEPLREQIWKQSSRNFNVTDASVKLEGENALLSVSYLLPAGNLYIIDYRVYPEGIVNVKVHFTSTEMSADATEISEATRTATFSPGMEAARKDASKLIVPRIGIRFRLPATMNTVNYFGRGPEDNYCDRKAGTLVGLYRTTAEEMYFPYIRPQENGHHTDIRWLSLTSGYGAGLLVVAGSRIEFNALRNAVEDFDDEEYKDKSYQWNNYTPEMVANHDEAKARNVLRKHTHVNDVSPRNYVEVCVDMQMTGVAGYNSWGARPEPEYSLFANRDYKWDFTLMPIKKASEAGVKSRFRY
jgi:beta-galactosidase